MPQQPSSQNVQQKPIVVSQPSADVLKTNFEISDSDEAELLGGPSGDPTPESKKEPEPKKEEVKQPVDKKEPELEKKEPVDKKTLIKDVKKDPAKEPEKKEEPGKEELTGPNLLKTLDAKKQIASRDYTGFSDEETKVLKSMSNDAFNYIAPILKSRKDLEKLKDASYLQHPDAYVLHPEYREKQQLVSQARREANAWQQALIAIRKGEEWQPLTGIDSKTGEFIYGEKRKPTVEDEEQVRNAMNRCLTVEQQTAAALQQLPQQFQQTVQQDNQLIQQERAKRFDWVANPELMKYEIETDGGKKSVETLKGEFVSLFPLYHQRSIGVEIASDLWVAMQILSAQLKLSEAGKAREEILKEEAIRVEPSSGLRNGKQEKGKFGVKEFDLEGMPT